MVGDEVIHRFSLYRLACFPVLVAGISIVIFSQLLPSVVESCSAACTTTDNPLSQQGCFFSAFWKQLLATEISSAFVASFLALVTALLNISNIEASRVCNQPSTILTRPVWIWIAVNAVTGAVVSPTVLIANIKRHQDHRRQSTGASKRRRIQERDENRPLINSVSSIPVSTSNSTTIDPSAPESHERELVSDSRSYIIPISVVLGFIVPSIALVLKPDPLIAGLWNLFPIAIYIIGSLALKLVPDGQGFRHAESHWGSSARLYSIPILLSLSAHVYLVSCWLTTSEEGWAELPAVKLMVTNFWTICATYLYWIFIESSPATAVLTVLTAILAGPGAGVSIGWVLKEQRMVL
ncbi:hypothetical protein F5Y15DRAFT_382451 [Xylariaceae sp. FL0016]|nr:hypothetical protein F5Y15DRAFT_382451 [Xylariaceae sp. FL0016]